MARLLTVMTVIATLLLAGCKESAQMILHRAQDHMMAQDYQGALDNYDKLLAMEPGSKIAVFGRARALYELGRYPEALPLFEQFLADTESERKFYKSERFDAEFYRDKCKVELGQEVEQDPSAIPPPPMGE